MGVMPSLIRARRNLKRRASCASLISCCLHVCAGVPYFSYLSCLHLYQSLGMRKNVRLMRFGRRSSKTRAFIENKQSMTVTLAGLCLQSVPNIMSASNVWIFQTFLEPGRYPKGFADPVRSILPEYEPERSHMDLIRTRFHDFCPNPGILLCAQHICQLYSHEKLVSSP